MQTKFNAFEKILIQRINTFTVNTFKTVISPFSKISRKLFEKKNIHTIIGILIFLSAISIALLPNLISTGTTLIYTRNTNVKVVEEIKLVTEKSIRLPVDLFIITQGYHFLHPAIDFAAVKGSPVYPITPGTVILVSFGRFGYGNHVVVDHGNGLKSLYAHLSKIEVKEGEVLEKDSIIGLIGSTGWSTGPHLHFQVWEDNKLVNPRAFFEGYFGKRLASTK